MAHILDEIEFAYRVLLVSFIFGAAILPPINVVSAFVAGLFLPG
jgi:hypothetical protein